MEEPVMASSIDEVSMENVTEAEATPIAPSSTVATEHTEDPIDSTAHMETIETLKPRNVAANGTFDKILMEPEQQPVQSTPLAASEPVAEQEAGNLASLDSKIYLRPDLSVVRLIEKANHSAGKLVNLLVQYVPSFRDETRFNGRKVRFFKRAQIFVADLWAAFNGTGYGEFEDIGHLTMFAGKSESAVRSTLDNRSSCHAERRVHRLQSATNAQLHWCTCVQPTAGVCYSRQKRTEVWR